MLAGLRSPLRPGASPWTGRPRDVARAKARAGRRFLPSSGQPPSVGEDGPLWPPPRHSGPSGPQVEWPYWIIMVLPWITLGIAWLLDHLGVCLICVPAYVSLP